MPLVHFVVFNIVSLAVFVLLLFWVLRRRAQMLSTWRLTWVSLVVVVVGMGFAKLGANSGFSPVIYYGVPALVTLALPPVVFRMSRGEILHYVILAFLSSPLIHVAFSLLIGWHEYLPFWHIPSLLDLLHGGG